MSKFIQYVGSPQEINEAIKALASSDTMLVDLTGNKELESLFALYSSINPLEGNVKDKLGIIQNEARRATKRFIINDCHVLASSDIEPLINLYKQWDKEVLLFSNFEPLDLGVSSIRGLSINEPLPFYDYSLVLKNINLEDLTVMLLNDPKGCPEINKKLLGVLQEN